MKSLTCVLVLMVSVLAGNLRAQNGIYADVETSEGDFTIELFYAVAPKAVANFIRLAEGSCGWVHYKTGRVKRAPYYDGVTFHRVIAGFMSQTGSRTGDGTDGPGFNFQDESSGWSNAQYTVAMANSGPHTNGGQFYINASANSHLDSKHTVFGRVILYDAPGDGTSDTTVGFQVCNAINAVEVDAGSKPLDDVIIESITIRRIGTAAKNFDEHAQGLPEVVGIPTMIHRQGETVQLFLKQPVSSLTQFYYSTDMLTWQLGLESYLDENGTPQIFTDVSDLADGESQMVFHGTQVQYDIAGPHWPKNLNGRLLSMVIPELASQWGSVTQFTFTSENGGTAVNSSGSGSFTAKAYSHDWLGVRLTIDTPFTYTYSGTVYDVSLQLRLGRDLMYPAYIDGRHGGTILLIKNGDVKLSASTGGAMTLTR